MALTRTEKEAVVSDIGQLINDSKIVVMASYSGSGVKDLQALRRNSKANGTTIKVIKNRLFKRVLADSERFHSVDSSLLSGQIMYGFNDQDEVSPAQSFAEFAKVNPQVQFVGAITEDGSWLSADDVKILASLPGKLQLRGQLIGTLMAPTQSFASVLSGNIRGVMNVLNARAESIS